MRPGLRRPLGILVLLLVALFGTGLAVAGDASAHASVTGSDPHDGARLASAPHQVTITFDEPVTLGELGYLHVTDSAGARVDTGAAFHPGGTDDEIAATLRPGLGDGTYTESFRIISADSHPVAGVVRFVVGHGVLDTSSGGVAGSTVNGGTSAVFTVARWASYAGFALLGGLWLLLTVWPAGRDDRRARRIVWTGWGVMAGGALAELVLQGPYTAGVGVGGVTRWSLLDDTLHTDYGQFHCARLLLLGALGGLLASVLEAGRSRRARFEDAAWPLLVGLALTFSATGHADTTHPRWLSISADVVHLCSMAAWVGGLTLLLAAVLPRREPAELRTVLPAFSRVAFAAVVALAGTGTYAAWRGIGSWRAILDTDYGLLVCAKVVLFAGLVTLGGLSRRVIQRRLLRLPVAYAMSDRTTSDGTTSGGDLTDAAFGGAAPPAEAELDPVEHERMRRSVLVEVALAALVLAATAVLVNQPRGREALAAQDRQPVSAAAALSRDRSATVTVDPGEHGTVSVAVALSAGPEPRQITATALQPAQQLGPIPLPLKANGTDLYAASGVDLPVAGKWVITLVVTTSAFDAVTTDVTIHLN